MHSLQPLFLEFELQLAAMCFQWCCQYFNQVTGQGSQSGQGSQIFKGGQQEKVAQIVQLLGDIKEQCKWASYRTGVSASKLTSMEFEQCKEHGCLPSSPVESCGASQGQSPRWLPS